MSKIDNFRKVKDLKSFFIEQCRTGLWKLHYDTRFINRYFDLKKDPQSKFWYLEIRSDSQRNRITLEDLGVSKIRFYFLLRMIKSSANNYEKTLRKEKIAEISTSFFNSNLEVKRDKNLEDILN